MVFNLRFNLFFGQISFVNAFDSLVKIIFGVHIAGRFSIFYNI